MLTIVIPVKNGERTLRSCLESLFNQELDRGPEIVIIDSGSGDRSMDIAREYKNVRIISIEPASFNHGSSRTMALEYISSPFVLYTVQDAIAESGKTLSHMLSNFDDPEVMAVCGKQIVKPDKANNPLAWYQPVSKPGTVRLSYKAGKMNIDDLFYLSHWDNVCAMYRTDLLRKLPFKAMVFGEDRLWAKEALECGHILVRDDNSRFYHYHHESYADRKKRAMLVYNLELKTFGKLRPEKFSFYQLFIYPVLSIMKRRQSVYWIIYNIKMRLATFYAFRKISRGLGMERFQFAKTDEELQRSGIPIGKPSPFGEFR